MTTDTEEVQTEETEYDNAEIRCNPYNVLILGDATSGKTYSLKYLKNPEGVLYLNFDLGKKLSFRQAENERFVEKKITDPLELTTWLEAADESEKIHTVVVDTLTQCMEAYLLKYQKENAVRDEVFKFWGGYKKFIQTLMHDYVSPSKLRFIFLAHTFDDIKRNKKGEEISRSRKVSLDGGINKLGFEIYFSNILTAHTMPVPQLLKYSKDNRYLDITKRERSRGIKRVFRTDITSEFNDSTRTVEGMFDEQELYIDNNIQHLLTAIEEDEKTYI